MTKQVDLRKEPFDSNAHRDNFELIQRVADKVLTVDNPFVDFQGRVYNRTAKAADTLVISHGLNFRPSDFLITRNTTNATVTQGASTEDSFTITVSGATELRFLLGRFIT